MEAPSPSPTPTPIIAVEVTSTVAGVTADAFQNTVFVDAFKTTVAAAITGVDADMVTKLRVDGVPVNRRLTDGVEVTYEIVVPAATAAAKSPPAAPLKANGKLLGPNTQTGPMGPSIERMPAAVSMVAPSPAVPKSVRVRTGPGTIVWR